MSRFKVQPNGAGGYNVIDSRTCREVGSVCSHKSNAVIKCNRLNAGDPEWMRFYGAKP